jgi:glycosyltransferase involved in cell wall biosynthesis
LYDKLEQHELVDFKIYYCSDYGLSKDGKRYHPEFGELPNWDLDLVNGHTYEILKNNAVKKGIFKGFFGLMNFGIYGKLKKEKPDVLVINGWNYFTMIWAVFCCKFLGIKAYLRGDNTLNYDNKLSGFKKSIKKFIYGNILFPLYTKICYVGESNKNFFQAYNIPLEKLLMLPHAIDNKRFFEYYLKRSNMISEIKKSLEIDTAFNLLFVGRLHESKRVLDVIKAVALLDIKINFLIVGDGLMREELDGYIKLNKLNTCKILGFKNQKEIMDYYLVADAFVLSSNFLETWGLVVNEAMNFNLPIIVSNEVGCAPDLCRSENGYVYKMGDVKTLSNRIAFLAKNPNIAKQMGIKSGEIIKEYSYQTIIKNLIQSL